MDNQIQFKDFRFTIKPEGPIGTPWQSDTILGHLAWIISHQEGVTAVEEFLQPFLDGVPPFILSDGFPGNLLPVPIFGGDTSSHENLTLEEHSRQKQLKKARFITPEGFEKARKEGLVSTDIADDPFVSVETLHASLSRHTNSTGEGGELFPTYESFLKEDNTISVYARCAEGWNEKLEELLKRLSSIGYGRDKSTGIGAFQVERIEEFDGFIAFEGANGFISLSTYVPAENDPVEGFWRIRVKRGFLGELAGNGNPFKRPLIQFEPGAAFRTDNNLRPWYGHIIEGIAPGMPKAIQNCYTIAVPCSIPF